MKQVTFHQKILLYNDAGQFLTLQASYKQQRWDLPGGEVELPELHLPALQREIQEEAGLTAQDIRVLDVQTAYDEAAGIYYIFTGFEGRTTSDEVILSSEHLAYRWVTPVEFQALDATPYLKDFAKTFARTA